MASPRWSSGFGDVVEPSGQGRPGAHAHRSEHRRRRFALVLPGSNAPSSPSPCGTTTDVGIAAFYCLITDRRHEHAHSGAGAGAHPARAVALLRALTEAIQVRTTYITGSRDDLRPDEFTPAIAHKLRRARALMSEGAAQRTFAMCQLRLAPAPRISPGCWTACAPSALGKSWRSI